MFKVCSLFFYMCVSVRQRQRKKWDKGDAENERERSWATEQRRCEQLWHSQISPWLLSAGTWTLGLFGFGGQPRPHNPPSAPSSCLTPPWPRSEDRKIRAVPSQRDSFILPAGMLPVTRAYIMGNIAGPRRKQPLPPFLLFLTNRSSPLYPISFLLFSISFPTPAPLLLHPLSTPLPTPYPCALCLPSCLWYIFLGPLARAHLLQTASTQSWNWATSNTAAQSALGRTDVWACDCTLWYSSCWASLCGGIRSENVMPGYLCIRTGDRKNGVANHQKCKAC